jgi:PAS domain-containing protein
MRDEDKTVAQLLNEIRALRERNRELEASEVQLRLAEEAFWESEQRFRIIVDNAYDGICICEHPDQGKSPVKRLIYCRDIVKCCG